MRQRFAPKTPIAIAIAAAGALALAGCGGSGGGSSSTTGAAAQTTATAKQGTRPKQDKSKPKQGGGKSQGAKGVTPSGSSAKGKAGKTSVAQENATIVRTYGTAGSNSDRDQAAQVAALFLSARAAGNWTGACSNLAASLRSQLEPYAQTTTGSPTQRCANALRGYEAKLSQAARQSQAEVHALSLRVKGDEALLIYRNGAGRQYDIPMLREGGEWRVGAIAPRALA
jgi:hypothetical protein